MRIGALAAFVVVLSQSVSAQIPNLVDRTLTLSEEVHPRYVIRHRDKIWFSDERFTPHSVGTIAADGTVRKFAVPCPKCATGEEIVYIFGLTPGPDGNVWFAYDHARSDGVHIDSWIGRVTEDGAFTSFAVPTNDAFRFFFNGYGHSDITLGPDGNLWFTENSKGRIGRMTPQGAFAEYNLASLASPTKIVAGPDGNLWFTETYSGKIGRITPGGTLTEFTIAQGSNPWGMTVGRDGALWFTEYGGGAVSRITTSGTVTRYPLPSGASGPEEIVLGPDGALWFGLWNSKQVGRLETGGPVAAELSYAPQTVGSYAFTAPLRSVFSLVLLSTHIVALAASAKYYDSEYESGSGVDTYTWRGLNYPATELGVLSVDQVNGAAIVAPTTGEAAGLVELGFAKKNTAVGFKADIGNAENAFLVISVLIRLAQQLSFTGLRAPEKAGGAATGSSSCTQSGRELTCSVTVAPQSVYELSFDTTVTGTGTAVTSMEVAPSGSSQPAYTRAYAFRAIEAPPVPPRRRAVRR